MQSAFFRPEIFWEKKCRKQPFSPTISTLISATLHFEEKRGGGGHSLGHNCFDPPSFPSPSKSRSWENCGKKKLKPSSKNFVGISRQGTGKKEDFSPYLAVVLECAHISSLCVRVMCFLFFRVCGVRKNFFLLLGAPHAAIKSQREKLGCTSEFLEVFLTK